MARTGKRIRYLLEYALLRVVFFLLKLLPLRASCTLLSGLGSMAFALIRSRRRVAIDNVLRAGICTDRAEATRIARASFRHLAVSFIECLAFIPMLRDGRWEQHVRITVPDALREYVKDSERGMLFTCGHFGNWEIAGHVLSQFMPLIGVVRPMDNPRVEKFVQQIRFHDRFRSVLKHGRGMNRFFEALRSRHALGFMMDQHAGRRGMVLDFLGRPASTHTGVVLLAMAARVPLYFGYCRRTGFMQFDCRAVGPIECVRTGDRDADVRRVLERLNAELETLIRETPEQYMWGHRRWRVQARPVGDAAQSA